MKLDEILVIRIELEYEIKTSVAEAVDRFFRERAALNSHAISESFKKHEIEKAISRVGKFHPDFAIKLKSYDGNKTEFEITEA